MSKYLLIILLLILNELAYAQIVPKTINKTIGYTVKAPKKYDNKIGFVTEKEPIDFLQYIGLDLFLPKMENTSKESDNGYWKKDLSIRPTIHNIDFPNFDSISNKYYTIIDVQLECTRNSDGDAMYVNSLAFILLDKLSKDTLIFSRSAERNNGFKISMNPFVLVPYFTALQNKYDNNDMIFISKDYLGLSGHKNLTDLNTDKSFSLEHKSILKGKIELIKLKNVFNVENEFYGIFLSLKTQSGNTFCVYVNDDGSFSYTNTTFSLIDNWSNKTNDNANKNGFFLYKEYLNNQKLNEKQLLEEKKRIKNEEQKKLQIKLTALKTKYGERIADLIITQKVEIGMTKEMCLAAWGEPIDKSKTIRQDTEVETWTYSFKSRLIFKNGLLLEINQ